MTAYFDSEERLQEAISYKLEHPKGPKPEVVKIE
jgi:hypothetical protein